VILSAVVIITLSKARAVPAANAAVADEAA
jgi:hypothetical protein